MNARAVRKVDDDTAAVLARSRVEGKLLFLPGQMDRAGYVRVDKVLRGLGGKWDRKARAHVFPFPAAELVEGAAANGTYVDRTQALQFFQTPAPIAAEMAAWAVRRGDLTLEPSAGHGRLVTAALHAGARVVHAIELDERNCEVLRAAFSPGMIADRVDIDCLEFLEFARKGEWRHYGSVLMNPPFAQSQDVRHVQAAWSLVAPGGRLAAIVGEGAFFRQDRTATDFREWLAAQLPDAEIHKLPSDTFKAEGTGVAARLILAQRP